MTDQLKRQATTAWQEFDFEQMRAELGEQITAIIRQVDAKQEEGRTHNN